MVGKKNFLIKFEYGLSRETITGSLIIILAADKVGKGIEDSISDIQRNRRRIVYY